MTLLAHAGLEHFQEHLRWALGGALVAICIIALVLVSDLNRKR